MGLDSETAVNLSKKNITTCCAELAKTALKTNKLAKSFSFPSPTAENHAFEPAERCPSSHFEFWATGAFSACCSLRSVFQEPASLDQIGRHALLIPITQYPTWRYLEEHRTVRTWLTSGVSSPTNRSQ